MNRVYKQWAQTISLSPRLLKKKTPIVINDLRRSSSAW